ncbi:PDZ domain-containing protein [Georgenia sp. 311]|uniref:PDZ domain-containing protein n=1 Tax=Georgenia wutianyii TaxID=2585135 RepID=A0ABX5VP71_9MICO|nr:MULTISPECIES: trypsin-like peptidase domain-containing protein [Georgenia]QDB80292.1 PDZ domain-containing protein [Georgenia wutianyii]TNC19032.1 PDZ domain-containing protein [Georgenia sp. 311]
MSDIERDESIRPHLPADDERVTREQAEVDAVLLGRKGTTPEAATTPTTEQPMPAPHPAHRVPFAGEQTAAATPAPRVLPHGRRRGWAALGATAATAALLASLGTAAVTGALADDETVGTTTATTSQVIPASSTSTTPDWQAVTSAVGPSVVAIDVAGAEGAGQGSGVVIDTEGHVLTNSHVVDGAQEMSVTLADGRIYQAELVGQDETTDLAVVQIVDPPADLSPATLGTSSDLAVGQAVLAMGNPLGLDSTATTGIISALDRPVVTQSRTESVVTNAIQVDAAVNPGNSGGPLFDAQGRVIGINSSIATLSNGGGQAGSIGLGFAIPVDQAATVAEQLIENGEAEHAFLGVGLADTDVEVDGVTRDGAGIGSVEQGSPAADAGLERGDVVTAIDGRPVDSAASLTGYVRQYTSGESATLTVVRDGKAQDVQVTLATRA